MSKNQNNANTEKCRKPWPANCLWPEPLWDGKGDSWTADEIDIEWLARTCPQGKDLADVNSVILIVFQECKTSTMIHINIFVDDLFT